MGVKGRRITGTARDKLWMSIRIQRRFTLPDVMRTSGAKYHNTKNFIAGLLIHGYIAEAGMWTPGRAGVHKQYRLVRDLPQRPVTCDRCGRMVSDMECRKEEI